MISASDSGLSSALVLLDFSASFDTVDQSMLVYKVVHAIGSKGAVV